jgi:hypothetical protein
MKKTLFIPSVLFIGIMIVGCASKSNIGTTQGRAESIEEAYPDRFEKTVVGMDVDEFKTVWPEARRSGISEEGEIYEFRYGHIFIYAPDYYITTKFYFSDNKLVKYESTKGM